MATLGGDKRLLQAHEEAVNEALHELEDECRHPREARRRPRMTE